MRKVSDLTVEEFEQLLEEVVERKLEEFLRDSDEGLELTEWIKKAIAGKHGGVGGRGEGGSLDEFVRQVRKKRGRRSK